ncbi:MAG: hypothetical protein ACI837_001911 [Crocinitomicaceae bacterium]|jgi:uncharacterized protein (DUF1015 family)
MAKISPFRAIRPTRDKVHLVATRPFYSYKKNVLDAKLEDNCFSFLHIINPEFGSEQITKPNSTERFELIARRYSEFLDDGVLIQEKVPSLYIYRQTKNGDSFLGLICGASVDEYNQGHIKKHEATITSREELFTKYLNIVGYNAEPVLLSHSSSPKIDELFLKCTTNRPEYEFTTTDLITHELWTLDSDDCESFQEAFEQIPDLYIADGHHRSASSAGLFNLREATNSAHLNERYFLAYLIDDKQLKILEFNRLVRTLNNQSVPEVLNKLAEKFTISEIPKAKKPSEEHEFTMFLNRKWYLLIFNESLINHEHPVKSLDAEILTEHILSPILGIKDLKSDENIDFISGAESINLLEDKVNSGAYEIGFVLFPMSMEQVKKVADNNMIMPPKSTWVEPKLRSGITIYNINE